MVYLEMSYLTQSKFSTTMILDILPVITVFRSPWMTTKINGVATDLFCTGVIDHPISMILNQGPKTLI